MKRNSLFVIVTVFTCMAGAEMNPGADVARATAPAQSGRAQRLFSTEEVPQGLSAPDCSGIRHRYEQHRHAAVRVDGGRRALNPRTGFYGTVTRTS